MPYQETSYAAWDSIQLDIGPKQKMVLWALRSQGDMTDKQLVAFLKWPINCITGRRGELVKKGLLEERCKKYFDGKKCIVWGVTAKGSF